jgi:mRNA-degrading endonuclease RelE of RelBE toxin-antitoxin system
MNVKISYSRRSEKFLKGNSNVISEEEIENLLIKAFKRIFLKEDSNIDLKKMKGVSFNLYRVRKGNIRIVFSISKDSEINFSIDINDIGFRGNIY